MSCLSCGFSLRSAVRAIGVIGMVWTALFCLITIFYIFSTSDSEGPLGSEMNLMEGYFNVAGTLLGLTFVCGVGLNYILYSGATEMNATRCNVWYYVTLVSAIIAAFGSVGTLAYGWAGAKVRIAIGLTIQAYSLAVVRSFVRSIKDN